MFVYLFQCTEWWWCRSGDKNQQEPFHPSERFARASVVAFSQSLLWRTPTEGVIIALSTFLDLQWITSLPPRPFTLVMGLPVFIGLPQLYVARSAVWLID